MNYLGIMKHLRTRFVSSQKLLHLFFVGVLFLSPPYDSVFAQDGNTITIDVKDQALSEILKTIEGQTEYSFFYDQKEIDVADLYSLSAKNQGINNVLKQLFEHTNIGYNVYSKQILLQQKKSNNKGFVTGTVSTKDGESLPGVSVFFKGTSRGVVTDVNGNYNVKANPTDSVLIFSFIGMELQEVKISNRAVIDIEMLDEQHSVDEVVVTALGISRQEKSLGYAVSKVEADEITRSVSGNWMSGLEGKVAGLTLAKAGGTPGGSMRVTLRGDNSLNYGNNEALFVVDGIPISSGYTSTTSGANYSTNDQPVDYGNGASEINPDDIESVSVLKGPAAAALYGTRASNGAIIITTKSARKKKGIGVTINSSVTFEQAGYFPDFQTTYGPGNDLGDGAYSLWTVSADQAPDGIAKGRNQSIYGFGEKYDADKMRYTYASYDWDNGTYTKMPFVYADDWYSGLFQTGVTYNNTVSITGSDGEGTSTRLSVTDFRNEWIMPNTGFNRNSIAFTFNTSMNEYIDFRAKVNYNKKTSDNMPTSGYSRNNPMYTLAWGQSVNSMSQWKEEYFNGRFNATNLSGENEFGQIALVDPRAASSNPYRTLYENLNTQDKDRVFGSIALTAHLARHLSLDVRSGLDWSNDFRTQRRPFLTYAYDNGFYREQTVRQMEMNSDFMLRYDNQSVGGSKFGFSAMTGGNNMSSQYYNTKITLDQLGEEGVYNTSNVPSGVSPNLYNYRSEKVINSLYGMMSFSWDDLFFVDITGRNDWSSTLARGNWSYFYPSVATSVLVDKLFNFQDNAQWVDMLKMRLSWANVGGDTSPYSLDQNYGSSSTYTGSYYLPSTIPDPNIQPENTESYEVGIDGRLFRNRINFDVALYKSSTTNQIYSADIDQITGAQNMKINAGEISNKGVEVAVGFVPVKTKDFTWAFDLNWSKNKSKLVSVSDGWDPEEPLQTNMGTTIGSRTYIYSFVGEEMHKIYGKGFKRAPEGSTYVDASGNTMDASGMHIVDSDGMPVLDDTPDTEIANVNPDWRAGMTQRFRYKNLSLAATFTGQMGGHAFSVTNFALSYTGKLNNSIEGRADGLVHQGVNAIEAADGTVTYTENTTVTSNILKYYNAYVWNRDNTEMNTFSTSFLKLKEVRLDYDIPSAVCAKTGFLQGVSLGMYATNLFCITEFPQYDPEVGMLNGSNIMQGIETMAMPMTRTYGFNVKLSF